MEEEEEGGRRRMEGRREEESLGGAPSSLKEFNKTIRNKKLYQLQV